MVLYFTCEYRDPGGEEYIVYMGADKYENENLIEWGQTRDVWFHVDGLSSAHVYLRLPLAAAQDAGDRCGDLLDRIPEEVQEEMCQLVKANSIEGCKKTSVMIVWTPWANLHKDETCMQAGAVGFHDAKLRRLRRADKDKAVVKKLEKTRREAHPDLQQEKLAYERDAIKWRKNRDKGLRLSKSSKEKEERDAAQREIDERHAARDAFLAGVNGPPPPPDPFMVDALRDAQRDAQFPEEAARRRAGDGTSGLDGALGQLGVAEKAFTVTEAAEKAATPVWETEAIRRETMGAKKRWLHERGYGDAVPKDHGGDERRALAAAQSGTLSTDEDDAEVKAERAEEREAVEAIFGADLRPVDAARPDNICVTVTEHNSPHGAPPLVLDVLVTNVAPAYPRATPAVCVVGGGLTEAELRSCGAALFLRAHHMEGPVIFDLVAAAADEAAKAKVKAEAAGRRAVETGARKQRAALLGGSRRKGDASRGVSSSGDAKSRLGMFGGGGGAPGRGRGGRGRGRAGRGAPAPPPTKSAIDDLMYGSCSDSDSGDDMWDLGPKMEL